MAPLLTSECFIYPLAGGEGLSGGVAGKIMSTILINQLGEGQFKSCTCHYILLLCH